MRIPLPKPRKPGYAAIVIIWTFLTVGLLFGGQFWHLSWSLANAYASEMSATGADVATLHREQEEKLHTDCALPIDQAMARVGGTDRNSLAAISPEPSTDMAPAAGWMHHPDFESAPEWVEPPALELDPTSLEGAEEGAGEATEGADDAAPVEAAAQEAPAPRAAPRATPQPAPTPRPAPEPAPRAAPERAPQAAPQPAPQAAPQPAPQAAPQPAPVAAPAE